MVAFLLDGVLELAQVVGRAELERDGPKLAVVLHEREDDAKGDEPSPCIVFASGGMNIKKAGCTKADVQTLTRLRTRAASSTVWRPARETWGI